MTREKKLRTEFESKMNNTETQELKRALRDNTLTTEQKRFLKEYITKILEEIKNKAKISASRSFGLAEIKFMIKHFDAVIELLQPNSDKIRRKTLATLWAKRVKRFDEKLVLELLTNSQYRQALSALSTYARNVNCDFDCEFLPYEVAGFQGGQEIHVISFYRTINNSVPIHEFIHRMFTRNEYKTSLIEYYYGLKTGLCGSYFIDRGIEKKGDSRNGFEDAYKLWVIGKKQGWATADAKLRQIIFGNAKFSKR